ncbi:sensor domain-containing diguanylate cyclase [Alteromonas ponticola]|uniref:diguanylate cyclase n=1 Tax=Alteromonas aquimaris TaxID=2998417 RepID=A0ABT3P8J3_9ALTE|nr:sensor domain-containing diguanylate cyclase [Alteromonas aquimaris]MCW8109090.1 sensor domain-containing diguanylate cyclase [Alteromonas aquimaris]
MKAFRMLHRSFLLLFAIVIISLVTLVHVSITNIVAEQSRAQQQSLSPAVSLIVEQLLKPLHVSEVLGKSQEVEDLLNANTLDEKAVFSTLERLQSEFDLFFFLASEKVRIQYDVDGSKRSLTEGDVSWYFKYKDLPQNKVADIGKWEDPHFFIDIKIFNDYGEFLGFFGIGKSLRSFVNIFNTYKQQFGYDFLFVDENGDIMLSSDPQLMADNSNFTNLSELAWYASLPNDVQQQRDLNNRLITIEHEDYLVAEVKLNQFNWTVYLLSPLQKRQSEISQGFIISVVTLLVVIFSLFLMVYHLLYYFRRGINADIFIRSSYSLPPREEMESYYLKLMDQHQSVSVILVDVDNFSHLSDTYGRNVADGVLDKVASYLSSQLNETDVLGRWSSEEFIILRPLSGPHDALEFAQQLRYGIATLCGPESRPELKITASFGVSFTATPRPMAEVTINAEDALYQAKRDGCNLVRMQLIE